MSKENKYIIGNLNMVRDEEYVPNTCVFCGEKLGTGMFCPNTIGRNKLPTRGFMGFEIPACKFDSNVILKIDNILQELEIQEEESIINTT